MWGWTQEKERRKETSLGGICREFRVEATQESLGPAITGDGGKGKERPAILGAGEDGEVGRLLKNHQHIKKF